MTGDGEIGVVGFNPAVFAALAQAATPGPWMYTDVIDGDHNVTRGGWDIARCRGGGAQDAGPAAARDAVFIAYVGTHRAEIVAGLAQGQLVETHDQLSALPEGAVIRERSGNRAIYERTAAGWMSPGWELEVDYLVTLPATVLWRPAS